MLASASCACRLRSESGTKVIPVIAAGATAATRSPAPQSRRGLRQIPRSACRGATPAERCPLLHSTIFHQHRSRRCNDRSAVRPKMATQVLLPWISIVAPNARRTTSHEWMRLELSGPARHNCPLPNERKKVRMLQPRRQRRDYKTNRMNGASQRSQPPAVISQIVLCAIEIQLELFDLHIVGVRFTEN